MTGRKQAKSGLHGRGIRVRDGTTLSRIYTGALKLSSKADGGVDIRLLECLSRLVHIDAVLGQ